MLESKDPAIKLFGKEIPLPGEADAPATSGDNPSSPTAADKDNSNMGDDEAEKKHAAEKAAETVQQEDAPPPNYEETTNSEASPESSANPKAPLVDEETGKPKASRTEKEQSEAAANSQEKPLKKPDKILPCPRCNSMDTKFCYYNNYNINQPRHFCKSCQRYWTAGGTMRNVPVGAGRRKNKNSASHYRHITISEALQAARIEPPNGTHNPGLKTNGRVLNFAVDAPICESMASVLNLADKKVLNGTRNGFHKFQVQGVAVPGKSGENGDDCSSGSTITVSSSMEEGGRNPQEPLVGNLNGFPVQMPCLPGVPWPYPWNSAVPPAAFCPSGFPMPFYPAPYCVPGPWSIPWMSPQAHAQAQAATPAPTQSQTASGSAPNSPTLGKHSREGDMLKSDGSEKEEQSKHESPNGCVLVPKTLRIDDPTEAAKSSIWATLGINNESISGRGLFKGFQSKSDEKNRVAEPSPVLRANPAALSRSLNFQESV